MSIELNTRNILIAVASTLGFIATVSAITCIARHVSYNKGYNMKVKEQAQYLVDAKLSINDLVQD